jgi:hypothetical protein
LRAAMSSSVSMVMGGAWVAGRCAGDFRAAESAGPRLHSSTRRAARARHCPSSRHWWARWELEVVGRPTIDLSGLPSTGPFEGRVGHQVFGR